MQTRRSGGGAVQAGPWLRVAALLLALVVLGSGCDGKDDKAEPSPTTRFPPTVPVNNETLAEGSGACGFINRAEVEAAVGSPAEPGSGVRTKTNESCRWALRSGRNQAVIVISTGSGGTKLYDTALAQLKDTEPLPGVGDKAFVATDTVYALKGDKLLILQAATGQAAPARRQAAIKLMQTAITRN